MGPSTWASSTLAAAAFPAASSSCLRPLGRGGVGRGTKRRGYKGHRGWQMEAVQPEDEWALLCQQS